MGSRYVWWVPSTFVVPRICQIIIFARLNLNFVATQNEPNCPNIEEATRGFRTRFSQLRVRCSYHRATEPQEGGRVHGGHSCRIYFCRFLVALYPNCEKFCLHLRLDFVRHKKNDVITSETAPSQSKTHIL